MELEQLLSTLKIVCLNDPSHHSHSSKSRRSSRKLKNEDSIIHRFRHWCLFNKFNFSSLSADIFSAKPVDSLVLQWFKHHDHVPVYNHLVDLIVDMDSPIKAAHSPHAHPHATHARAQAPAHAAHPGHAHPMTMPHSHMFATSSSSAHSAASHSFKRADSPSLSQSPQLGRAHPSSLTPSACTPHHGPSPSPHGPAAMANTSDAMALSSHPRPFGEDPAREDEFLPVTADLMQFEYGHSRALQISAEEAQRNLGDSEFYYDNNFIDLDEVLYADSLDDDLVAHRDNDRSYRFTVRMAGCTVSFSVYELIRSLQAQSLSTSNAVWQRIPKNEDELIGDKQSLCLCVHILLCISVQNKYAERYEAARYNKFQTDAQYLDFLDTLCSAICEYFVDRQVRVEQHPYCLSLADNESASEIVVAFGDLVESLPRWLYLCNDIILARHKHKH